ncbi:MAG TPA: Calx-beta domain-containing protein, partial [Verrucomicrobiae bacterium]
IHWITGNTFVFAQEHNTGPSPDSTNQLVVINVPLNGTAMNINTNLQRITIPTTSLVNSNNVGIEAVALIGNTFYFTTEKPPPTSTNSWFVWSVPSSANGPTTPSIAFSLPTLLSGRATDMSGMATDGTDLWLLSHEGTGSPLGRVLRVTTNGTLIADYLLPTFTGGATWAQAEGIELFTDPGDGVMKIILTGEGGGTDFMLLSASRVTIAANDPIAAEPDSGTDTGQWTITRTGNISAGLTVNYAVDSGASTASSGDYQSIGTSVTFSATETTKTVTLTPNNDSTYEGNETVVLKISDSASYINGSPAGAIVTIESIRDLGVLSGDTASRGFGLGDATAKAGGGSYSSGGAPRAFLTAGNSAINTSTDNIHTELDSQFSGTYGAGQASAIHSVFQSTTNGAYVAVGDWVSSNGTTYAFSRWRSNSTTTRVLLAQSGGQTAASARAVKIAPGQSSTYHGAIGWVVVSGYAQVCYWAIDQTYGNSWIYNYGSWALPTGNSYGRAYDESSVIPYFSYTVGHWDGYLEDISAYTTNAFVVDNGTAHFLSTPYPQNPSAAFGVKGGSMVGFYVDGSGIKQPALWSYSGGSSSYSALGFPSGYSSYHGVALDVNGSGQFVGSISPAADSAESANRACLWTSLTATDLTSLPSDSSWTLYVAEKINASGQIVGYGLHNGSVRAFVMTP